MSLHSCYSLNLLTPQAARHANAVWKKLHLAKSKEAEDYAITILRASNLVRQSNAVKEIGHFCT
jgi:hypothetical protein